MALSGSSYSSVADVLAWSRPFIEGETTFNSTTRPTLTEVESFIDDASSLLNTALAGGGFSSTNIKLNSTATKSCDIWVRGKAVSFVENVHAVQGFGAEDESNVNVLLSMPSDAQKFVKANALAFKRLNVTVTDASSDGLTFTGQTLRADRADPDDTSLEQPTFTRKQFDNS